MEGGVGGWGSKSTVAPIRYYVLYMSLFLVTDRTIYRVATAVIHADKFTLPTHRLSE